MSSDFRRRLARGWRLFAVINLALTLVFGLAGVWLFNTASGARAALGAVQAISGGNVAAEGVEGVLAGPLRISRLVVQNPDWRITLADLSLDWRPRALLSREVHVTALDIGHLGIVKALGQKEETAPQLPKSIALPFRLTVDSARVNGGQLDFGPVTVMRLDAFAVNLGFDGEQYRLRLDQLAGSSGARPGAFSATLGGQMTLAATRPFALDAAFSTSGEAEVQQHKVGLAGNIRLNGSLAEILAEVDFSAGPASAAGNAVLRPFSEVPLASANIVLRALDLAAFGLPTTALSGKLFAGERRGEVVLGNAAAGSYDQGRLPVTDLRVAFRQGNGQFIFEHIVAALGSTPQPGGALDGSGHITAGRLAMALNVKALDLSRLDRRLRTTHLGGRLELGQDKGRHELTLELAEPAKAMGVSAKVAIANDVVAVERAVLRLGEGQVAATGRAELAGGQAFSAEGKLGHFRWRDLGRFEQLPDLLLNGAFSLHGTRSPKLAGDLEFNLNGSQLAGQPLAGEGEVLLRADSLRIPKLLLTAGANRLSAEGELAGGEGELRFALAAQQLAQLGQGFGGSLQADGTLRGSLERPRLVAAWKGSKVRRPGALPI